MRFFASRYLLERLELRWIGAASPVIGRMWDKLVRVASEIWSRKRAADKKMPRLAGHLRRRTSLARGQGRMLGYDDSDYFLAAAVRATGLTAAADGVNWLTAVVRLASSASTACLVVLLNCS